MSSVILSHTKQLIGDRKDVFPFQSTLSGYRNSYKTSIGTLDRELRATGFTYQRLCRVCRESDKKLSVAFARVLTDIPLRHILSVEETDEHAADMRIRRGRCLREMRYDCPSRAEKNMLRTSIEMPVPHDTGFIHCVNTPTPPAQNSDA